MPLLYLTHLLVFQSQPASLMDGSRWVSRLGVPLRYKANKILRLRLTLCNKETIICLLTCLRLLTWDPRLRLLRDRIMNRLYMFPYSYTKLAENLTEGGRSSKNICVLFFESLSTTWRCNNLIFQSNFLKYLQVIFLWQFCSIIVFLEMIKTELLTSINPGGPRWSRGLHLIFLLDRRLQFESQRHHGFFVKRTLGGLIRIWILSAICSGIQS